MLSVRDALVHNFILFAQEQEKKIRRHKPQLCKTSHPDQTQNLKYTLGIGGLFKQGPSEAISNKDALALLIITWREATPRLHSQSALSISSSRCWAEA